MTARLPSDSPNGRPALWRSLISSAAILGGTFFFINSACLNSGGDEDDYKPCAAANEIQAPAGATATILEPSADQVFSLPAGDGRVEVSVRLSASGIEIVPAGRCQLDSGHFLVSVERTPTADCLNPGILHVALDGGETEWVFSLPPGSYALAARVVNGNGTLYQPEVVDNLRFVIEGPPPSPDAGACP